MAAQTMFSVGMFPMGVQMMEDAPSMSELPRNNLPVPQLVMLANVATVGSVDGAATESVADDKEMVELTTVGCSYSDSEDSEESVRYSYDSHNNMEVCIVEYVNSPGVLSAATGNDRLDEEEEEGDDNAEDLSKPLEQGPPVSPQTPQPDTKRKTTHATVVENAKKKKPFHCKPCNFQAQNEEQFVEHLGTHGVNKMAVVNRVEARSKIKSGEMGGCGTQATEGGGDAENGGDAGATTDSKGVIRCERCGYNTNRTDHYIAHLKHHSKEGEDHRVLKCTLCPYTTVSQYHWRKHLRNHFPSKLHTCSQCSYYSDRKSNYIQHIRTHTGVRPFRCDYCEYSSSQKTHLTRHMRTHSGERPFKCESCNYLAANQHEVTRHARQVHNGPKPLACPYCQYKTADRSNFKKHVELHLNPRQFLCPLCKYAASKKCNLQYHIKSRHSGCDIAIDVSKVKLRVKKADQETGGEGNAGHSSVDEDDGDAEEEIESIDKQLSPINLSIVKSGSPGSAQALVEETVDKVQRKCEATADKDKPQEGNAKVERKVMTRQKKVAKIGAKAKEKTVVKDAALETAAPAKSKDFKVKRRSKKQNAETVSVQDQVETTESSGKAKRENSEKDAMGVDVARSKAEKEKPEKEKKEDEAKVAKEKEEQLKNEGGKKENKRLKSRKSGARKPDKPCERVEEAPCKDDLKKTENNKLRKTKAVKRKFVEALDLSTKPPSAEAATGPTKSKRLKAKASDKPPSKPSSPEVICNAEGSPAPQKDHQAEEKTAPGPVKQKKTRRTGKKAPAHQCSVAPIEDKQDSVGVDASSPLQHSSSAEPPNAPGQETQQPSEAVAAQNPTETQPEQQDAAPEETSEPVPELTSDIAKEPAAASSTSSGEETPSPAEDFPPPMFRRPTKPARPSLELPGQRGKPADAEEDEGIHSSHEGGSDISDSASEGSDDSGLNGAGAGSGKMPNDPETPTEEIPTPTELKSHTCIFCDRTFPLEVAYRRHLNRHLVNVYYMDNTAKSGK